jgi:hypothetical protein
VLDGDLPPEWVLSLIEQLMVAALGTKLKRRAH